MSPRRPLPPSLLGTLRELGEWISPQKLAEQEAAAPGAWPLASAHLAADGPGALQDVSAAVALCEGVYRADDHGEQQAEVAIQRLQRQLPAAPRIHGVQWSPPLQEQRYVVADAGDALVVAFLGTKRPADHLVNLRLRHAPVFQAAKDSLSTTSASTGMGSLDAGSSPVTGSASTPAAHSGYLTRAAGIPVEQLYSLARVKGKRLVLAGHSLGGAVATLCSVRLLDALPDNLHHTVSCIGFAVPPVGNAQLAAVAAACGWQRRITNYTLPEDFVPGLLGIFGRQSEPEGPTPVAANCGSSTNSSSSAASVVAIDSNGAPIARSNHAQAHHFKQQRRRPLRRPDFLFGFVVAAVVTLTSALFGGTGMRLLAAIATLPSHLLPHLVHVGRQISLPAGTVPRAPERTQPYDPLVPSHATGRLAAHRMITYRLRIIALYTAPAVV